MFLLEFLFFQSLNSMFPDCSYSVSESVCLRFCVFLPAQEIVLDLSINFQKMPYIECIRL